MYKRILFITLLSSLVYADIQIQREMRNEYHSGYSVLYDERGVAQKIQTWAEKVSGPVINGKRVEQETEHYIARDETFLNQHSQRYPFQEGLSLSQNHSMPSSQIPLFSVPDQNQASSSPPIQDLSYPAEPAKQDSPTERPKRSLPNFTLSKKDFDKAELYESLHRSCNFHPESAWADAANHKSGLIGGIRSVPHQSSLLDIDPAELRAMQRAQLIKRIYTIIRYGMEPWQLDEMMGMWDYREFVDELLRRFSDSEEIVWELWNKYKDSCYDYFDELPQREEKIKQVLRDKRLIKERDLKALLDKEETNAKQEIDQLRKEKLKEEQFALRKKSHDDCWGIEFFDSAYIEQRREALTQTQHEKHMLLVKSHEIDSQTTGFLQARNISIKEFKNISGTTLQHQLVDEVVTCYQKIAIAHGQYHVRTTHLTEITIDVAQTSFECNKLGNVFVAGALSSLSDVMADTLISIGKGACASIKSNIDLVLHPDRIVEGVKVMGNAIRTVAYFVREIATDVAIVAIANKEIKDAHLDNLKSDLDDMTAVCQLCFNEFKKCPTQKKIEFVAQFATDCIVAGKCFKVLSKIGICLGQIRAQRRFAQMFTESDLVACATGPIEELAQKATGPIDELTKKTIIKECIPTTSQEVKQGLEALIEEESIVTRPISEILADIEKARGKASLSEDALFKEIKTFVHRGTKNSNPIIKQDLRKKLSHNFITENGIKKKVNMNLDHVLNSIVEVKKNKKTGSLEINFSGGHLAGSTQALEDNGLIKIINRKQIAPNCWEYEGVDVFTGQPITKTEFPTSWSAEYIIQQSWNLFYNKAISEFPGADGKFVKYTKLGKQDISIVFKRQDKNINIITAVPYKIEKK